MTPHSSSAPHASEHARTNHTPATLTELIGTFADHGKRPALLAARASGLETIDYEQLVHEIRRVAAGLRAAGVGRGDFVALWAPNGPEWITTYLGVIASGAAVIPIDQQSTVDTVLAVLAHAAPKALFTDAARHAQLGERPDAVLPPLYVFDGPLQDDDWQRLRAETDAPLPQAEPDDVAALLYTSGTTGTPKAVPLTHRNLASNTAALRAQHLITRNERVLLPLPLHHTYPCTVGMLTVLGSGATIVLPAGISGPEITRAAAAARATALLAVPRLCTALWDGIVAGVRARGPRATRIFFALLRASIAVRRHTGLYVGRWLFGAVHARLGKKLSLIGCGGAKLPADLAWNLEGLGWKVLTGYGLTETSPVVTFNDRRQSRLGTEGRPLPGVEVRIDDTVQSSTETEEAATSGEIQVRGPSVFSGYWRNEEATAAAFTADGWFRTGDLGWLDEKGFLHVVGRSKELIVLADGKKVFPEDTEKLYMVTPLLREIALLEHDGRLAALIVPNEQAVRERGAVREAALIREELEDIAARLPPYQRVSEYRITREPLPRTQLGKLRRHLLPDLYRAAAESRNTGAPAELDSADRELLEHPRAKATLEWLRERYAPREISLDTSPQLDLQIDSLAWVSLTIEIERRFGVALTGDAVSRILSVRDLLHEVNRAPAVTASAPTASTVEFKPPGSIARAVGAVIFVLVRFLMRVGFRLEVRGVENLPSDTPYVITPNHVSYLDPLAIAAALPWQRLRRTYWAAWVGVMYTGWLTRLVSRATQVFPVDPDRDLAGAIRIARSLLQQGYSIVWFPEGRRSPTGTLESFQGGVGLLLEDAHVPAVPTAIFGTFEAWPKHARRPRRYRLAVAFGKPRRSTPDGEPRIHAQLHEDVRRLLAAGPSGNAADGELRSPEGTVMAIPDTVTIETLADGSRVAIRPIRREDVECNAAFIRGLSPPSKHFLFLGGISELGEEALRRLCDPDQAHDMAFVAFPVGADGMPDARQIGVCRYAGADSEQGAEISVAVADDWQHKGLGTRLLERLIEHARRHGVRRLYSIDAADNARMRKLAAKLGFQEEPNPDDIREVVFSRELP